MIKFDFTSHFIIVLYLMVILVSTLIIINYSVNSKWCMGLMKLPPVNMLYATGLWIEKLKIAVSMQRSFGLLAAVAMIQKTTSYVHVTMVTIILLCSAYIVSHSRRRYAIEFHAQLCDCRVLSRRRLASYYAFIKIKMVALCSCLYYYFVLKIIKILWMHSVCYKQKMKAGPV